MPNLTPGSIENILTSGIQNHTAGNLPKAEGFYRAILQIEPHHPDALHLLGVIAYQTGKYNIALDLINKALKFRPKFAKAYSNLGNVLKDMGRLNEAVVNYQKALAIKPDLAETHSNLGLTLQEQGQPKEAVLSCKRALAIEPDFVEAHVNLGNALKELECQKEAINCYHNALAIKPDYIEAHYNLGTLFHTLGQFEEAILSYQSVNSTNSRAKILECLYASKKYAPFYSGLKKLLTTEKNNIRAAAISAFASHQLGRSDPHPFCKNPMDFVRVYDGLKDVKNKTGFLHQLVNELTQYQTVWEPSDNTTVKGFQSKATLNLFKGSTGYLADLEGVVRDKIDNYRSGFTAENCDFIKLFPKQIALRGWFVRLLKGGHQNEHIHPDGWLSGVFYVKVPKKDPSEEGGSIEFGLWGYDYPIITMDYPKQRYYPKNGDIILFPSSLFHKTIPFKLNDERISIAFDVVPT